MKKLVYFMLFISMCFLSVHANPQFEFGLFGSRNITYLSGKFGDIKGIDELPIHSFGIGGIFNLNFNEWTGIQFEPHFCSKGGQNSGYGIDKHKLSLTYLDLPVLLRFKVKKPYFQIGGYHSVLFLAKHEYKIINERNFELSNRSEQLTDQFNGSDNGIILGIGIDIPVKDTRKYFTAELQYLKGFTDIVDDPTISEDPLKNYSFSLKVGVMF